MQYLWSGVIYMVQLSAIRYAVIFKRSGNAALASLRVQIRRQRKDDTLIVAERSEAVLSRAATRQES